MEEVAAMVEALLMEPDASAPRISRVALNS
jgi:hypothetical protein